MAANKSRHTMDIEKRGGYGSSSKPASQLATPPRGPAPGAKPAADSNKGASKSK